MKTINKTKKTTSMLIATILLTGMIGSMGQTAHAGYPITDDVDFEAFCDIDINFPIDTTDNSVTLKVGTSLPGIDGFAVTVGDAEGLEAFQSNGAGNGENDTPRYSNGTEYAQAGNCFYSDDESGFSDGFNYYISFENPVTSLSLDLYDYSDDGNHDTEVPVDCTGNAPCDGDIATLTVYSNLDQTTIVATTTYTVDDQNWADGQVANLSIAPGEPFVSASITFSNIDRGTGIDNIIFEEAVAVDVAKYYDSNLDGIHDEGEEFLDGWLVHVNDTAFEYEFTNATYVLPSSVTFTATEFIPNDYWIPTNDTVVTFNSSNVDEILFSNVCVGESGENPHTKGFWSNKNGQKLCEQFEDDGNPVLGNLTQFPNFVDSENIVQEIDACGDVVHNKETKTKNYLKKPTYGNINYTLSQQLLTMVLNNATQSVNPADNVYCHSIGQFFNLTSLMMEANATLAGVGSYAAGDLAECLDDANNDMHYVQDEACEYGFGTTLAVSKELTSLGNTFGNDTAVPSIEGDFWWNVTVTNTGIWPAVNANLTDISNSTADHSNLNGCNDDGAETFCDLGDLENGTSTQIDISGAVETPGDIVVNTASTIAENALEAIYVLVNTIIAADV
jgi:hypothetical protein